MEKWEEEVDEMLKNLGEVPMGKDILSKLTMVMIYLTTIDLESPYYDLQNQLHKAMETIDSLLPEMVRERIKRWAPSVLKSPAQLKNGALRYFGQEEEPIE